MRILILSQYYDPEPIPKPSELAEGLTRRRHDVAVLTGLPNYPSGVLPAGYRMSFQVRETIRGIPVRRVFEWPYHGTSAARRIANYGSFMLAAISAGLFVKRPSVIYVWHPPLTAAFAGAVIGAIRRVPIVLDVQDIWPEAVLSSGMLREGMAVRIIRVLERFVYRRSRRILVLTEGAKRNLVGKGVLANKISVVPNWVSGDALTIPSPDDVGRARSELNSDQCFVVTFAGNLGVLQGLDTVLAAAERLQDRPDIAFRIIGDGSDRERLETLARRKQLRNVRFMRPYPSARMPALLAASGALLVHLSAGVLNELTIPAKTLAYMAAGRPVIAATGGATAELVDRCGGGVSAPGGDAQELAAVIARMAALPVEERERMGVRARQAVLTEFDREALTDEIEAVLREAAGSPS